VPAVVITFTPVPAHVRTARLVALATARRAGVDEGLLDEIRFAVGEACSRAVGINSGSGQPVVVTMSDEQDRFTIEVRDTGQPDDTDALLPEIDPSALAAPESTALDRDEGGADLLGPLPPDFGLAVINGLVEQVAVTSDIDGTRVTLTWPAVDVMAPTAD
jgi:anti-sigma regulatory factor (Ser/Thr protein kinase)